MAVPQDTSQLDPKVVKVMSAIKKIESGGDYNAVGDLDKGVSRGAYQFNKDNFKTWAGEHGLDPNDFSPANQNKVAYARIKKLKDEGRQPEEIAAIWNGARKTPEGTYTYINPEYGEKFRAALGVSAPAQSSGLGGNYAPPPEVKPFEESVPQETQKEKPFLQKAAEFVFPILEEKERTPLQTVGDIGLSAMSFIPGLGAAKVGALGAKGAATGLKGLLTSSNIAKGAGIGYGADVASNLSQGKEDLSVLAPGLGTATGGVGGSVISGAQKFAPGFLSRTSGVPQEALERFAQDPSKLKGLITSTPKETRQVAVEAVKGLRKKMSSEWESGVQTLVDKYTGIRVGVPEEIGNDLVDIASRYNTATKKRISLPQNAQNMSAKELTDLIKDLNGIKYNPLQPDRALMDMKTYLKNLGKQSFNQGDEFTNLYANYATKSDILDNAEDIVKAFKAKSPTQLTTAINKLQKVFDSDKEEYLRAIQALEKETGVDILSGVAANKVAPRAPIDIKAGLQINDVLQWLGYLVTSPRSAAELNALLTGKSSGLMSTLSKGAALSAPILPGLVSASTPQTNQ